jgi:transposase
VFRLGLLPTGHIMPKEERGIRDLACKGMQLVHQRTVQILLIETQMDQQHDAHLSSNLIKKWSLADIDAMPIGVMEELALKANLKVKHSLEQQIDIIIKALAKECKKHLSFPFLKSMAGIGAILATVILLEIGFIERFKVVGNDVSYCRCVSSSHTYNAKKKSEGNTKNGNRF